MRVAILPNVPDVSNEDSSNVASGTSDAASLSEVTCSCPFASGSSPLQAIATVSDPDSIKGIKNNFFIFFNFIDSFHVAKIPRHKTKLDRQIPCVCTNFTEIPEQAYYQKDTGLAIHIARPAQF